MILVLIPAYNEEKNIGRVVYSVRALGFPVLVVDDGSADGTVLAAQKQGAEVIGYSPNRGKGYALQRGFEWFLARSEYQALILMDSDGQHDPADLSSFVKALQSSQSDLILGNRMDKPEGMPRIRRWTNGLMSGLLSLFSGCKVPDTQCGYRAIRREALARCVFHTTRFEIESEMILEAARTGSRIESIPVRSVYEGGLSHIHPFRDTGRFILFLFQYFLRRKA